MALEFIRAPSKASLLAMLKKAKEINPRLLRSLFDGVVFKSEMTGYLSGGGADHGNLSGLADDDHLQYGRTDGTRAITGQQTFEAGILTDTIGEETSAAGVTVDTLLIKDGNIAAVDYAFVTANDGATSVTAAELEELTDAPPPFPGPINKILVIRLLPSTSKILIIFPPNQQLSFYIFALMHLIYCKIR